SSPKNRRIKGREIPLSYLVQSETKEIARGADSALDTGRVCPVQLAERAQAGARRRREYGGCQPSGRAPSCLVHPAPASLVSNADCADSRSFRHLSYVLVWRHLSGSEESVRQLSGRAGIVSNDESRDHIADGREGDVAQDPHRGGGGPDVGGTVQMENR